MGIVCYRYAFTDLIQNVNCFIGTKLLDTFMRTVICGRKSALIVSGDCVYANLYNHGGIVTPKSDQDISCIYLSALAVVKFCPNKDA